MAEFRDNAIKGVPIQEESISRILKKICLFVFLKGFIC